MNRYKPEYLGKVIPADNPSKMTDFVENKYDAFNKVYDTCKDQSANIADVKAVDDNSSNSLSVQVIADSETMEAIKKSAEGDQSVTVSDGIITAKT